MKNYSRIFMVFCIAVILLAAVSPVSLDAAKKAKGFVFDDINKNGVMDKNEKGIPGVVVSNQMDTVKTNEKGFFKLPVEKEGSIVFVTKPAGYQVPLDKNNIPFFYYIHQPAGSPKGLKFEGIDPTGKLPKRIYFPLVKTEEKKDFNVLVVGDPQTRTAGEVDYFRDQVIANMMGTDAAFYIALGDIMYDDLNHYDKMNRTVGQLGVPAYQVMGNHDMNFKVPDNKHEMETYKRVFGPDYYSFNYSKVHFVVLNSVKYQGWDKEKDRKGRYIGQFHEKQLTWLKNDLSHVPEDHLIVFSMHIPIFSEIHQNDSGIITNRADFFKLVNNRKHLLALAGHMHFVEYLDMDKTSGWTGAAPFPLLTAGAGCGSWWNGPKDGFGVPLGMCTDGTPNGYFLFQFNGNKFSYRFMPPAGSPDEQMRINSPIGIIKTTELTGTTVNVNVFAGTPRTKVTYSLDGGPQKEMERKVMDDPLFSEIIKSNVDKYPDWYDPTPCSHIWTAPLTENLQPGVHRIKITVIDHQNQTFTAHRLFEITN